MKNDKNERDDNVIKTSKIAKKVLVPAALMLGGLNGCAVSSHRSSAKRNLTSSKQRPQNVWIQSTEANPDSTTVFNAFGGTNAKPGQLNNSSSSDAKHGIGQFINDIKQSRRALNKMTRSERVVGDVSLSKQSSEVMPGSMVVVGKAMGVNFVSGGGCSWTYSRSCIDSGTTGGGGACSWTGVGNQSGTQYCVPASASDTTPPVVNSITLKNSPSPSADSIQFEVIFDESVNGVDKDDFELTGTGSASGSVASVSSSSGSTIDVTVNNISGQGTLRLDLKGSTNITDDDNNGNGTNGYVAAYTGGTTHTVDMVAPNVTSITPKNSPSPSADSIQFSVIFDESANDVSIDDFILTSTDSASGSINAVSSSSGSAIDVTVNSISGQGTLRLDLKGSANITDDDGNGNGTNGYVAAYTGGTAHTVDRIAPDVSTIVRKTPSVADTNSDTLVWTVSFSKSVSTITTGDFEVSGTTASVTSVSATSGSSVDVTVSGGDLAGYSGGVALSLAAGNSLQDSSGNSLSSTMPTGTAESYTLDNGAPSFLSVSDSSDSNYKAGETVTITVDLGETGLNVTANLSVLDSDFSTTQALTDNNDDTYSFQTPALDAGGNMQEGTFAITVTATDAVGNENTDNSLSLTLDKTPPTFSSADSVPTDNAFGIASNSNLVLDFSENVELVSGKTFAIYDLTNGAVLETYTASSTTAATGSSSGAATLSGDKLTISPSSDFSLGNRYAVTIDSTTLQDPSGNVFAGISDYITYNFAVQPELKLTVADSNIAENSGSTTYTVALIDGNGNAYSADENITVEMALSGTAVSASDYSVSGLDGSNQITIATGDATNTFTVTSNSDASDDDGEIIIIGMNSVATGAATIGSVASQTVTINQNDQPVIAGLDATPLFSEGGSAVVIDSDVTVSDTELDALNSAQGNYDGASITIVRAGGAQSGDVYGSNGSLSALVESGNVTYNGTVVGTVTTNSAGTLTLTFNSNATTAVVNSVLQNITYENTNDDPASTVSLSFVFNDGIENSSAVQVTASITAVNDVPTLSATGSSPTFVEGGAAAVLFSSAAVSTVEASQTLAGLMITVTNVADATNEKLTIDGTSITLTAGQSGSTSNFSYAVSVLSTTATVTLTGGTLTEAQMQSVIDAISYQNDSDDPTTASSRVVTIASISETGSANTVGTTAISSTVSVGGIDDEPVVSANGVSPTYIEGATASNVYSSASVDAVESSQSIAGATLTISGLQDGNQEVLVVDETEITLVQGTTGTTSTLFAIDYSVSVSGNVATVTLSNIGATAQSTEQLLNSVGYLHKGDDPTEGNRVVTLTQVSDNGLDSGGNDNLNDTLTIASTVSVSAVDDAPALNASALNPIFTENGSSVSIFSSAAVDTVEASQLIESITWQVSGVTNSGGEYLVVDGTDVSLVDGVSGTSSANSFAYQVSVVSSGVFSVSVSKQDTASNYQTLIDGIAYKNTAENIVTGSRTISITNLVDSGGSDGSNLNSNSSLSLTSTLPIVGVNDDPSITIGNQLSTDEDNNQTLSFNFSDVDGDTVTATEKSAPSHGEVAISGTDIVYTPTANYNGSDSFTITLTDGNGYTVDKTINVTVSSVNDEPSITIASTLTTDEDNNQTLSFNFSDVDGDTVTATEKSAPSHGQIAISGTDIVYTPTGNYNGSDSFTITLTDGNGYTVDKTITVTVSSVNDEPSITIASTLTTDEDNNQTLSFNFSDVDGDTVTATEKSAPSHGEIAISGTDIVYTPTANYNGSDSFTITLTDGNGYTVDKTINVTVSSVNDEPSITIASTLTTDEDNNQTLSFNFSDVDGDTVTATEKSAPSHGEVAISGTDIVYTPTANYNGSDSFTITLTDGNGYTVDKTINVTVSSVNDEPSITIASTLTTDEDNNQTLSFNFSDVDGDTVTATEKSAPSHGQIVINGTDIVYTPTANYNGSDSFTITLTDGNGYTVDKTITVTVSSVNDEPSITIASTLTTDEDNNQTLSFNFSDADGDTVTATEKSAPSHGQIDISGTDIVYTPNANYNGSDSFTITLTDGNGYTVDKTINVTVSSVNDEPSITIASTLTTDEDNNQTLSFNFSDVDGDTVTATEKSAPSHGQIAINGTDIVYTPTDNYNGSDSFTITLTDGNGYTVDKTINVTVSSVNDEPSITIASTLTTDEDNNQTLSFNFSDVDGDTVTATEKSAPSHGQIAISGTDIVYTPTGNYNGSDSFTITLTDGNGYTVDKTINVTVSSVNDEPSITIASTLSTDEDNNKTLSFNFSDVDGDTVTATEKSAPSHGQIVINGTDIVYTPTANYNGSDSFTIILTDGNGYTVDKTVNVTVSSVNDEPSITIASTLSTDEDNN
ncbi:tandem-95 repeat protein, partial [Vibrio sp. DNB22_10_4]